MCSVLCYFFYELFQFLLILFVFRCKLEEDTLSVEDFHLNQSVNSILDAFLIACFKEGNDLIVEETFTKPLDSLADGVGFDALVLYHGQGEQ